MQFRILPRKPDEYAALLQHHLVKLIHRFNCRAGATLVLANPRANLSAIGEQGFDPGAEPEPPSVGVIEEPGSRSLDPTTKRREVAQRLGEEVLELELVKVKVDPPLLEEDGVSLGSVEVHLKWPMPRTYSCLGIRIPPPRGRVRYHSLTHKRPAGNSIVKHLIQ